MPVVLARAGPSVRFSSAPSRLIEDLIHQGGSCRCPDTPVTTVKRPQRELHVDVPQVVLRRAPMTFSYLPLPGRRCLRHRDLLPPGEILPGDGLSGLAMISSGVPAGHHLAAVDAGAGADVDRYSPPPAWCPRRAPPQCRVLPRSRRLLERRQQLVVVPLVQADGGLVQDIQHPHQARSRSGWPAGYAGSRRRTGCPALRERVRYSSPTDCRNPSRARISFRIRSAISVLPVRSAPAGPQSPGRRPPRTGYRAS